MLKKLLKLIYYILLLLGISFLFIPQVWWLGAIIVALSVFFLYKLRKKTPEETTIHENENTYEEKTIDSKENKTTKSQNYIKPEIKSFIIKGIHFCNLDESKYNTSGTDFIGKAMITDNPHDKYAVGIYDDNNTLLGYVSKGNQKLYNYLDILPGKKVIAFGWIRFDSYYDKKAYAWDGSVNIPTGYSNEKLELLTRFLTLKKQIPSSSSKITDKSTENYLKILNIHKEITSILIKLNDVNLSYSFPKNILPSIGNHLLKEKEYEKLIELEEYDDLIMELNEKYRISLLNKIEDAKRKLAN